MSPKERIMTVLEMKEPDEVPIGELAIDKTVIEGFNKGYRNEVDLAFGEGLSLVTCLPEFRRVKSNADGTWSDEWGCLYSLQRDVIAHPIKGSITVETDLKKYSFPDPNAPHRLGRLPELLRAADGRIAINFHSRVAFMWSVYLMDMENVLMAMALEPDFVHELFSIVADINITIIRNAIRAGASTVSLGDDYCSNQGSIMSPEMFRTFILPHLTRAVEVIHEEGAKCIKHCDGNLWPILDDMVNAGIDCINPLEPVAGMKMSEVKATYGDRICIMGNIDCSDLLCNGTPEEVDLAVQECIRDGGEGGGLIVSSSNSIHSGVNPENYRAMLQAVKRHGKYPLR